MKNIKIGDKYYYNNGQVTILKIETDDFVLVQGVKDLHTQLNGSQFCEACNVESMSRHKCSDVDEIIEEVINDLSEDDIFWVNIKHLQEKPFEYKKWEKITEENNQLLKNIKKLKEYKESIEKNIEELATDYESDLKYYNELKEKKEQLINELDGIEKNKIVLENIPEIKISNSNLKIPTKAILKFIKDSIFLEYLNSGGVDNWEWYSESLPDCDDIDEFLENQALEELAIFIKN